VKDAADRLVRRRVLRGHPTFFEVLTAAAFAHFRHEGVDVAVLEVGLGGRLDATNVAEPLVSAIVSVDFDHEVYLGRTLAKIAREKAGVLRAGRATVVGPLKAPAARAVAREARSLGARVVEARHGTRTGGTLPGTFDLRTPSAVYAGLEPLPGAHQRDNLVVAVRLLEEARRAGLPVELERVPDAIAGVDWPGRLQRIAVMGGPAILLDGAHNPAGARALAAHLRGGPPFVLLFGAMADKDVRGLARPLFPLATEIVLTRPRLPRAAPPAALARRAGRLARGARREPRLARALELARRLARSHGADTEVVVAGSLYLVGGVLARLERERALLTARAPRGSRTRARPAARRSRGRSRAPRARGSSPAA
jgi:dihydrofolate synthase/folylpolyglutamate synthase